MQGKRVCVMIKLQVISQLCIAQGSSAQPQHWCCMQCVLWHLTCQVIQCMSDSWLSSALGLETTVGRFGNPVDTHALFIVTYGSGFPTGVDTRSLTLSLAANHSRPIHTTVCQSKNTAVVHKAAAAHLRSAAALSRSRRLSISICFSPVPLTWPPPATLSRWLHMRVRRGSWYSTWASSTCRGSGGGGGGVGG